MKTSIITPTYRTDLALVKDLCRSIDAFLPDDVIHYLVVSRRDYKLFAPLASPRRKVLLKQDVLPKSFFQVPLPAKLPLVNKRLREWFVTPGRARVNGWIVQQIIKMSAPSISDADLFVFIDSDVRLVRRLDSFRLLEGEAIRFLRKPGAAADQAAQQSWNIVAGKLLGLPPKPYYGADYVGSVVSWRRDTLLRLQQHIARVANEPWPVAIARHKVFSEYMTYGVFIDQVENDGGAEHFRTDEGLALNSWNYRLSQPGELERFVGDLKGFHIGVLLQSIENIPLERREAIMTLIHAKVREQDGG